VSKVRNIVTTPALRISPVKSKELKNLSSILTNTSGRKKSHNIRTDLKILGSFINIESRGCIAQSSVKQIRYCPAICAAVTYYVKRQLLYVKDIGCKSDKFLIVLRELAPTVVAKLILDMYYDMWENTDTDMAAQLSSATPVILWAMFRSVFRSRKYVARIAANVIIVTARYGLHRYKSLQSSESKAVNSNLSKESTSDSTDLQESDKDSQVQLFQDENVISREEITGFIMLVVYILTASVLNTSLSGKIITEYVTKSQSKGLVKDIHNFLSQCEQHEITSKIKSDLLCIKNCIRKCKNDVRV
jgi:hypothetical protein